MNLQFDQLIYEDDHELRTMEFTEDHYPGDYPNVYQRREFVPPSNFGMPAQNQNEYQNNQNETIQDTTQSDSDPDEYDWHCPICSKSIVNPIVTECGHVFCWKCIKDRINTSNECPVCKHIIEIQKIIPVYGQGIEDTESEQPPKPTQEYHQARREHEFFENHFPLPFEILFNRGFRNFGTFRFNRTFFLLIFSIIFMFFAFIC